MGMEIWLKNKIKFKSLKKIQCTVLHMQMLVRLTTCKIILETAVHKYCTEQWMRKNISFERRQKNKNIREIIYNLKIKNYNCIRTTDGLMCADIYLEFSNTVSTSFKPMFWLILKRNSEIQTS